MAGLGLADPSGPPRDVSWDSRKHLHTRSRSRGRADLEIDTNPLGKGMMGWGWMYWFRPFHSTFLPVLTPHGEHLSIVHPSVLYLPLTSREMNNANPKSVLTCRFYSPLISSGVSQPRTYKDTRSFRLNSRLNYLCHPPVSHLDSYCPLLTCIYLLPSSPGFAVGGPLIVSFSV